MRPTLFDPWLNLADSLLGVPLARVLLPCLGSSVIASTIVVIESFLGGRSRQWYLVYNLMLAWIPLGFAWITHRLYHQGRSRSAVFWSCATAWLLFLPNAPYLMTDLVHLLGKSLPHFWPDLVKILLFALSGLTAGFLSLQLVHNLVTERKGWLAGWAFVVGVSILCSVGVSLGRFRRWNSWDALQDPSAILRDAYNLTKNPYVNNTTGWFFVLLALLIFCSYAMFYSLRHQSPATVVAAPAERPQSDTEPIYNQEAG